MAAVVSGFLGALLEGVPLCTIHEHTECAGGAPFNVYICVCYVYMCCKLGMVMLCAFCVLQQLQ